MWSSPPSESFMWWSSKRICRIHVVVFLVPVSNGRQHEFLLSDVFSVQQTDLFTFFCIFFLLDAWNPARSGNTGVCKITEREDSVLQIDTVVKFFFLTLSGSKEDLVWKQINMKGLVEFFLEKEKWWLTRAVPVNSQRYNCTWSVTSLLGLNEVDLKVSYCHFEISKFRTVTLGWAGEGET